MFGSIDEDAEDSSFKHIQKYGNVSHYIKQFVKANVETGIDLRKESRP